MKFQIKSEERAADTIRTLKEFGILKFVRSLDAEKDILELLDEDAVVAVSQAFSIGGVCKVTKTRPAVSPIS
jgi:hypothetical protein